MKQKTFCEGESAIKPCLMIVVNLLHGGKHTVDKAEQIPLSYNKHSMYYDYIATSAIHLQYAGVHNLFAIAGRIRCIFMNYSRQ